MYRGGKFLRWGKHPRRINSQKRRGMARLAQAQKNEIEARQGPPGESEEIAQESFVSGGRFRGSALRLDAVDVRRRRRHARKQRLVGHTIVAVGMIGRHRALVAPEEMNAVPRDPRAKFPPGERGVQRARRVPARERDGEASRARNRLVRRAHPLCRGLAGEIPDIGADDLFAPRRHDWFSACAPKYAAPRSAVSSFRITWTGMRASSSA